MISSSLKTLNVMMFMEQYNWVQLLSTCLSLQTLILHCGDSLDDNLFSQDFPELISLHLPLIIDSLPGNSLRRIVFSYCDLEFEPDAEPDSDNEDDCRQFSINEFKILAEKMFSNLVVKNKFEGFYFPDHHDHHLQDNRQTWIEEWKDKGINVYFTQSPALTD